MTNLTHEFLSLARPENRQTAESLLSAAKGPHAWATLQQGYLDLIGRYLSDEVARGPAHVIDSHEAGGQFRIAFGHLGVRHPADLVEHLRQVLSARVAWTREHYHHGYHDVHEVHHEPETFLYFQMPLLHLLCSGAPAGPGKRGQAPAGRTACPSGASPLFPTGGSENPSATMALASIEDFAEHAGNWADGVPDWYDWTTHGFRSTWLGTRGVRAHPPYDYQEANHFRFLAPGLAAYTVTKRQRYLDLATDYANRWCDHIEHHAATDPRGVIPCQILPEGADSDELGKAGANADTTRYQIFYATAALNTTYDIAVVLLDLYRLLGTERYLHCYRLLLDQFLAHSVNGRPAQRFAGGRWEAPAEPEEHSVKTAISQSPVFVARLAVRHDMVTGADRYRRTILDWASEIDERRYWMDQTAIDPLVTAHWYTGEASLLERAHAMAVRLWAVCEHDMGPHGNGGSTNCGSTTRYGSKFLMELLYHPLLLTGDPATRGGLPLQGIAHVRDDGTPGLPEGASFRAWRTGASTAAWEALNTSTRPTAWAITPAGVRIELAAGQTSSGTLAVPGE